MTVVLKKQFQNDVFIEKLNEELTSLYGANTGTKFRTWAYLQEEADFLNNHSEGIKQVTHIQRPITKEYLEQNFFWYNYATFSFKLSGGGSNSDESRDAVAICKWIIQTNRKYIDTIRSNDYQSAIIKQYLNYYFEDAGYDLDELWRLPNPNAK
jgi:hypothetical protein